MGGQSWRLSLRTQQELVVVGGVRAPGGGGRAPGGPAPGPDLVMSTAVSWWAMPLSGMAFP